MLRLREGDGGDGRRGGGKSSSSSSAVSSCRASNGVEGGKERGEREFQKAARTGPLGLITCGLWPIGSFGPIMLLG